MKTYFFGYGYRDTKEWSCPDCKNFHACGMDLQVDVSKERHQQECPKRNKGLARIFEEASRRALLKDLVFVVYQNPDKVEEAIEALKKIAEGM